MSEQPETALWRAVIVQAIEDATSRDRPEKPDEKGIDRKLRNAREAGRAVALHERNSARIWLLRNSADFREVCHLALLDPDAVREQAQALSRDGWLTRRRYAEAS